MVTLAGLPEVEQHSSRLVLHCLRDAAAEAGAKMVAAVEPPEAEEAALGDRHSSLQKAVLPEHDGDDDDTPDADLLAWDKSHRLAREGPEQAAAEEDKSQQHQAELGELLADVQQLQLQQVMALPVEVPQQE